MFLLLIGVTSVFDVVAAVMLRAWAGNEHLPLLVAGVVGFALAGLAFAFSMKYEGLAVANVIWIGASVVLVSLAGIWVFGERLVPSQMAGIVLVVVGILMVERG